MARRKPHIEWRSDGSAVERILDGPFECPNKEDGMRGVDGYGPISWTCQKCGGHGGHQGRFRPRFVRRPEYDAPKPGSLEPELGSDDEA